MFSARCKQLCGTQWHENPLHEWIQLIGKKQVLPYVLQRSTIVSKGVQFFSAALARLSIHFVFALSHNHVFAFTLQTRLLYSRTIYMSFRRLDNATIHYYVQYLVNRPIIDKPKTVLVKSINHLCFFLVDYHFI